MKKLFIIIPLLFLSSTAFTQSTIDPLDWYKGVSKDSIKRYKIYNYADDSTYVDTTLNIKKFYKHNLLRRDDFYVQKYANQGENYSLLSYQETSSANPQFGFRTKHLNYLNANDIKYYDVATPYTELGLKMGYYRGQFLDALFTTNLNPNLNISIGYKGLRSVGRYINSLTSHGNFQTTVNYITKDKKYRLKAHFTYQDLLNQESGGIESDSIFRVASPDYSTRTAFTMNLKDAESFLKGKRFYVNHYYILPLNLDSTNTDIFVQHIGIGEQKLFSYADKVADNKYYFGSEVFNLAETGDTTNFTNLQNDIYLGVKDKANRTYLKLGVGYNYQKYGYDTIKVVTDHKIIPKSIYGTTLSAKVDARIFLLENLYIKGNASYNISGKFVDAFDLYGKANLNINKKHNLGASLGLYSFYPEMQFWLYQSNYKSYNYYNKLEKQYKLDFKVYFESDTWFDVYARFVNHKEYTYFESIDTDVHVPDDRTMPVNGVTPVKSTQYGADVNIAEFGIHKDFKFGVFGFDTRTVYQKVMSGEEVFRVPEIITRNTIYYHDNWFRHALEVQTGIGVKYFTEYSSFQYNPLIGSYFRPKEDLKIGNYPYLNFFFNARIRTVRIFLELENASQPLLKEHNYFSAPHYPSADFSIRFGLVWNFFS